MEIRNATLSDAKRILEIYAYYVNNTAITFENQTPSLDEFKTRMQNTMKKYPYIVISDNEKIIGYAYAGAFNPRAAYDWACELSIYIDKEYCKKGAGRALYEELEERLGKMGILNLYACIAYPEKDDEYLTSNSADFHNHLGFTIVGKFHNCGYKLGRWYNMIWMEKIIGEHTQNPPKVEPLKI